MCESVARPLSQHSCKVCKEGSLFPVKEMRLSVQRLADQQGQSQGRSQAVGLL